MFIEITNESWEFNVYVLDRRIGYHLDTVDKVQNHSDVPYRVLFDRTSIARRILTDKDHSMETEQTSLQIRR